MALLNCPSLTTYSQVLNNKILLTQSKVVFIRRNTMLTKVKELFFALFLFIIVKLRVRVSVRHTSQALESRLESHMTLHS